MDLKEMALLTAGRNMWSTAELPDVPSAEMADGPMGIASGRVDERDVATLTPCPTALGASWDVDLVRRVGAVVGQAASASGVDMVLAPNLNLARSPLAGRAFEFFSEDPYLTGALGASWIAGLQAQGTGSVTKHVVCNDSETDRDTMNAVISEAALRDTYLLPFEMAAEAGCAGFLMAYNRLNGTHCVEHADLLKIIKTDWQFDGFTVSDWFGTKDGLASARAGLDLEMPGPGRHLGPHFLNAVEAVKVSEFRLRDASTRVAKAAKRWTGAKAAAMTIEDRDEILTEAAAAGFVLLKNEGAILPLDPTKQKRIAIIGPNATAPCYQGGTFAKIALDPNTPTPLEAIRAHLGDRFEVLYEPGVASEPRLPDFPVLPVAELGDGARGFTVSYYSDQSFEMPVAQETRNTNSLTWFANTGIKAVVDADAGIRAAGLYKPTHTGVHRILVGGTGSVRVRIDGDIVFERALDLKPGDIMGRLKSGDADGFDVQFDSLTPRQIEIDLTYKSGRVQGLWFGMEGPDQSNVMFDRAIDLARTAHAVILMVGETSDSSVESKDRETTHLSPNQIRLIEAITGVSNRVVVVANVGHGIDTSWEDKAAGLLLTFYPGQAFAQALAEVLDGTREPGGRLPLTIAQRDEDYGGFHLKPAANGDLPYQEGALIGYRHFTANKLHPRHAIGSGMGYAEFKLERAQHDAASEAMDVVIRNVSRRDGKCVMQIYATIPGRAYNALVGFASIVIPAGQVKDLRIPLSHKPLRTWDPARGWRDPAGAIQFAVGQSIESVETVITVFSAALKASA